MEESMKEIRTEIGEICKKLKENIDIEDKEVILLLKKIKILRESLRHNN
jgi:hypothetical protein